MSGTRRVVEQHAVGFVDDRHAQPAQQRRVAGGPRERVARGARDRCARCPRISTVAQVIEGELARRCNRRRRRRRRAAARAGVCRALDRADAQAQRLVERPQRSRVAPDEIVVRRDDVHRHAAERGHGCRSRRGVASCPRLSPFPRPRRRAARRLRKAGCRKARMPSARCMCTTAQPSASGDGVGGRVLRGAGARADCASDRRRGRLAELFPRTGRGVRSAGRDPR